MPGRHRSARGLRVLTPKITARAAARYGLPLLLVPVLVLALTGPPAVTPQTATHAAKPAVQALHPAKLAAVNIPYPGGCSPSGNDVVCTYGADGHSHDLAVPVGASNVRFTASGAKGGNGGGGGGGSSGGAHGNGASVSGTLGNVAGTTLHIGAGSQGALDSAGTNPLTTWSTYNGGGGGDGTASGGRGGGGGAASVIYASNGSPLVVAGGGGGAGGGSGNGVSGPAGANNTGHPGGSGGTGGGRTNQNSGGGGGSGSNSATAGGGGGGGGRWAGNGGGGGGGYYGAGGGGEGGGNSAQNGAFATSVNNGSVNGDGSVVVTYTRSASSVTTPGSFGMVYAWQSGGLAIPFSVTGGATGTVIGTDTSSGRQVCTVALSNSAGTCTVPADAITGGITHIIQLVYSGDSGFLAASSAPAFYVYPDPISVKISAARQTDGTYQVVATADRASVGIVDTTLSISSQPAIPDLASECKNQTSPTSSAASPNTATLQVACTISVRPGNYTLRADSLGTANNGATFGTYALSAAKYSPASVNLAFDNQALDAYGKTATATVTVAAPANALVDPAGPVTVSPATGRGSSCTAAAPTSTVNHVATYSCAVVPGGGTSTWRADFAGDSAYNAGSSDPTSATSSVTVAATPPTVGITASAPTITAGQTLSLSGNATNPADGSGIAAGTLTFYDGPAGSGGTVVGTVDLAAHPGGGTVSFTPVAGDHKFVVQFTDGQGGADYVTTTRSTDTIAVQPLASDLAVAVTGDASSATASGIPTTVVTTLKVAPADTLTSPVALSPAPATACSRTEATSTQWRTITVTCAYVEQPGTSPTYTASYTDALVGALRGSNAAFTVPASPTSVTAGASDETYGDASRITATVGPTVTGARVSGTVTAREGATVLCSTTVAPTDRSVHCDTATPPHAGTHPVTVTYVPDDSAKAYTATSPAASTSFTVSKAPASISLGTPSVTAGANPTMSVTATATADAGGAAATGSVTFGGATSSCGTETLSAAGVATCSIPLPTPGTKASITVSYSAGGDFVSGAKTSDSATFQRAAAGSCTGGFNTIWQQLQAHSGASSFDAGPLGSVSLTAPSSIGACDTAAVLGVTGSVSLFQGTLQADPLNATITSTSLCLDAGDKLTLPAIWKSGALVVTQAICFPFTAAGGLGAPTSGTLALANSGGTGAPLLSIPGVSAAASLTASVGVACAGKAVGDTGCTSPTPAVTVVATVARTSDTVPGVTVTATVRTDGSIAADVAVTPVALLGTSVALSGSVTRAGTGSLSAQVRATTTTAATAAPGLTLDPGATVALTGGTGSSPTLTADGTVRLAAGTPAEVAVAVHGSVTSMSDYSLTLATAAPAPTWTPVSGLSLNPTLAGSLVHHGALTTFALSASGSGGSPLATWSAPGGVTVTVGAVSIGGDPTATDLKCPFTDGSSVLALSGTVGVGALSVAASGCVDLASKAVSGTGATAKVDRSWHLAATATNAPLGRLTLGSLVLDVTHPAGGTTDVVGSAQATLSVGSFTHTATVTMSKVGTALVVGGRIDGSDVGLGSAYVAYASDDTDGWQTGITALGDDGEVDLPAGISLFGTVSLPSGVAAALRQAKFSLPADATVTFEAVVPKTGGSLSFTGELAAPSGLPLLTLPGATLVSATLTYADRQFSLAADGTVTGQDGKDAPVHVQAAIGAGGTLSGSGSVTGLGLFGHTVTLSGSVSRTAAGVLTVALTGSIAGTITMGDASLTGVTVTAGTAGLSAAGTLVVASTSVDFSVAFASTTTYALKVSTTIRNWTPAPGVTVNAVVAGTLTRTPKASTYDFAVTPASGASALLTLTPATGMSLSLNSFELSNRPDAPTTCSLGAPGDTWLAVSGSLSLSLGGASGTGTGSGCFDLTKPAFSITVSVPGADFGGEGGKVSLSGLAVTVSRDASGAFAAQGSARLKVQMPSGGQFSLVATLTLNSSGFAIGGVADLSSYLGSSAATAYLYYANATLSVNTGDKNVGTLKLTPGITVGLAFSVSDGVASALHTVGIDVGTGSKLAATVHLDLGNATIVLKVGLAFQQTYLLQEDNGTSLRIDSLTLAMTLSPTQPSFAFEIAGTLHVPASVPGGAASDVGLSGGIRIGTELSAYLTATNWHDAFGLQGLSVKSLTLQGGITLTGLPLPSLAVSATVDGLPSSLADVIGYQQGAPLSVTLAIGETNLLVDVSIGTRGSTTPALAPFHFAGRDDLLSVNFAELYLSPTGATVGDTVYPAGFSLTFDGKILGIDVSVDLRVNPSKPSLYFSGKIGTISIGSFVMGPTTLTIDVSPGTFDLTFTGHVKAGPGVVQIGPLLRIGGRLEADVSLSVGTSGLSAHGNFTASVYSSNYVPQDWCKSNGIWLPCDYQWVDTSPLNITLTNLGFDVNASGITIDIPNTSRSITIPWPKSPFSANERSLAGRGATTVQTLDATAAGGFAPVAAVHHNAPLTAGTWQPTGSLGQGRVVPASVRLRDGSVLVAGGADNGRALATAEIYDPATGGWHAVASMDTARINPTLVQLRDGRVLVVGGDTGFGETATAEIFDPKSGRWSDAGALSRARQSASAAVLPDGSVLVAGGHVGGTPVTTVDRFVPSTGQWHRAADLPAARAAAAATTLAGGDVLLAGGMGADGPLRTAVRYRDGHWVQTTSMADARWYASATTLAGGDALVAGGVADAERYDPTTDRWSRAGQLTGPTALASMVTLPDGDVLVLGGLGAQGSLAQVDRYDVTANRWTALTGLPSARAGAATAVLGNGNVLVAGGLAGSRSQSGAFVYAASGRPVAATAFRPARSDAGGWSLWAWVALFGGITLLLVIGLVLLARRRTRTGDHSIA